MGAWSGNPYASPETESASVKTKQSAWRRPGKIALGLFVVASPLIVSAFELATRTSDGEALAHPMLIGAAIAFIGSIFAMQSVVAMRFTPAPVSTIFMTLVLIVGGVVNLALAVVGALMAVMTSSSSSRGRQLRRRGKVLLPK